MLPEAAATDEFFRARYDQEQAIVREINAEFPIETVIVPQRSTEINGLALLEAVGAFLYEGSEEAVRQTVTTATAGATSPVLHDEAEILRLLTPKKGTRYLFITGKGGVGKSTIAIATAVYLAGKGYRTLVLTTDPASHLPEIFGQELGNEPTQVNGVENLYATQIDPEVAWNEYTARILDAVKDESEETKKAVQEDLSSPCAQEMAAFEKFMSLLRPEGLRHHHLRHRADRAHPAAAGDAVGLEGLHRPRHADQEDLGRHREQVRPRDRDHAEPGREHLRLRGVPRVHAHHRGLARG